MYVATMSVRNCVYAENEAVAIENVDLHLAYGTRTKVLRLRTLTCLSRTAFSFRAMVVCVGMDGRPHHRGVIDIMSRIGGRVGL